MDLEIMQVLFSLKIQEEIGNKRGIVSTVVNIVSIYHHQGDISKAFEWNYKALKITEEINDKHGLALVQSNLGRLYLGQDNFVSALEYFNKSLKIYERDSQARIAD